MSLADESYVGSTEGKEGSEDVQLIDKDILVFLHENEFFNGEDVVEESRDEEFVDERKRVMGACSRLHQTC